VDEWTEYYEKYSEWYSQYSKQYQNPLEANSTPKQEVKQLSFEELQQQVMRSQYFQVWFQKIVFRIASWKTISRRALLTSITHSGMHSRVPLEERACTG